MLKFAILSLPVIIMLTGCSLEPRIEYKEKLVPVKCKIQKTQVPAYTGDLNIDIPNILVYTEVLEKDIEFCTTGKVK